MALVSSDAILWYDIDEGTGATLNDETGNSHTGTITGATWATGSGIANLDDFLSFDGSDYWKTATAISAIHNVGALAFSFWIRFDDKTDNALWSTNDIGSASSIQAYLEDNTPAIFFACSNINNRLNLATSQFSTATWYHFCLVFDGAGVGNANRLKLYINGALATVTYTGTIETTTVSTTGEFIFGIRKSLTPSAFDFQGDLTQFAILNRAITSTEVNELYNAGAGVTYTGLFGGGGGSPTPLRMLMGMGS